MGLAIALGARNLGRTWPNPSVGAILVDESGFAPRIISQGITQPGGRPHAETAVIAQAGGTARGATLYVSLEPCSHFGRTPPCAEAIVAAGITRVFTAIEDPDPRVAGRGHAILRSAGIDVTIGIGAAEAARAHRGHISRVVRGRPWLTLKLARTADGYAGRGGGRLFITGDASNARTHMMRAHADAVLIGISTVLADNPRLDVRLPGLEERSPVGVVLDSLLRLPSLSRLSAIAAQHPSWIVFSEAAPAGEETRLIAAGFEVIRVTADPSGRVDLATALLCLGERGLTRIFCEGGPTLAAALGQADLVDELVLMTGAADTSVEGGAALEGIPALQGDLAAALRTQFRLVETEQVGPDTIESFERIASCSPAL